MLAVCWMVGVAISVIRTSKFVQKEIVIIRENIRPEQNFVGYLISLVNFTFKYNNRMIFC